MFSYTWFGSSISHLHHMLEIGGQHGSTRMDGWKNSQISYEKSWLQRFLLDQTQVSMYQQVYQTCKVWTDSKISQQRWTQTKQEREQFNMAIIKKQMWEVWNRMKVARYSAIRMTNQIYHYRKLYPYECERLKNVLFQMLSRKTDIKHTNL